MAGIYIHIPFCTKACIYCNFHFSTNLSNVDALVNAIVAEIKLRQTYLLPKTQIDTIYIGGGTPSLLTDNQLRHLFEALHNHFDLAGLKEFTIEANPDDISTKKLKQWKQLGINRLSIGVQSFNDSDLNYMGRIHNASQAIDSVKLAIELGITNVSIDLIYGVPNQNEEIISRNLAQIKQLGVTHFSAYALTVEEKTVLQKNINTGKTAAVDPDLAFVHFNLIQDFCENSNYSAYEISNYSIPTYESKHNSAYWAQTHYIGLGPSAHSFDGNSRAWNISNNAQYIKIISSGNLPNTTEQLSSTDKYNEYIMTALRTIKGISLEYLNEKYGEQVFSTMSEFQGLLHIGKLEMQNGHYYISQKYRFQSDGIAAQLFIV
ncbi:MAG: radical SAM family heme chaperone HemW [Bacteroidota bacterium]|nr:radical SAM family heme chaperone HemW [Bacteroidota bacterium]